MAMKSLLGEPERKDRGVEPAGSAGSERLYRRPGLGNSLFYFRETGNQGLSAYYSCNLSYLTIDKIQNKPINSWEDITNVIHPAAEETLSIVYLSRGDTIKTSIVPDKQKSIEGDSLVRIGIIGIESPSTKIRIDGNKVFSLAWQQSWNTASLIYRSFSWLFQRKVSPKEVSGPIGIVMITKKSLDRGFISLLMFVALITINLAIVNLIPIPPLDGFHIIMSFATFTSRRPPSKTLLKIVQTVGTIIILLLMALIIFNDVIKGIQGRF